MWWLVSGLWWIIPKRFRLTSEISGSGKDTMVVATWICIFILEWTFWTTQFGGGSTRLRRKQPAGTNEKTFSFYPYEVVSYPEGQKTVPSESITQIPFENQCRSALSTLIHTAEKARSQYHYVNFPCCDTCKHLKEHLSRNQAVLNRLQQSDSASKGQGPLNAPNRS